MLGDRSSWPRGPTSILLRTIYAVTGWPASLQAEAQPADLSVDLPDEVRGVEEAVRAQLEAQQRSRAASEGGAAQMSPAVAASGLSRAGLGSPLLEADELAGAGTAQGAVALEPGGAVALFLGQDHDREAQGSGAPGVGASAGRGAASQQADAFSASEVADGDVEWAQLRAKALAAAAVQTSAAAETTPQRFGQTDLPGAVALGASFGRPRAAPAALPGELGVVPAVYSIRYVAASAQQAGEEPQAAVAVAVAAAVGATAVGAAAAPCGVEDQPCSGGAECACDAAASAATSGRDVPVAGGGGAASRPAPMRGRGGALPPLDWAPPELVVAATRAPSSQRSRASS